MPATPDSGSPGRVPYLDGLRGIAILLVVTLHYLFLTFQPASHPGSWFLPWHHLLGAAWVGVDLFFVLSGFLLGGILLDHQSAPNLCRVFYLRRACRILPLYFLLLSPLVIVPALGLGARMPALESVLSTGDIPAWTYPVFLQNLAMAFRGSWGEAWVSTTWSLAVEEQFYLILPWLILFVPRQRLPVVLFSLALLAPVLRIALHAWVAVPQARVGSYMLLPCRWDSLFLGVLAAWLIRDARAADWLRRHAAGLRGSGLLLAATGVAMAWYSPSLYSDLMGTAGYTVFALLFAITILCGHLGLLPGQGLLVWPPLRWIGRVSYSLYLIHLPVCSVVFRLVAHKIRALDNALDLLLLAGCFALCLVLAAVSWKFLEQPILDFARKTSYRPAA